MARRNSQQNFDKRFKQSENIFGKSSSLGKRDSIYTTIIKRYEDTFNLERMFSLR